MSAAVDTISDMSKENLDPSAGGGDDAAGSTVLVVEGGGGTLAKLFQDGQDSISISKNGDLFQELDKRALSAEEEEIIRKRVDHQRKMLEMFERSEKRRKVAELQDVCPDLSEEEAAKALDFCSGKEDEAASRLTSDPAFLRKVQIAAGGRPQPVAAAPRAVSRGPRSFGQRPKLVDTNKLGGSVFVGSFRGKGAQAASKAPRRACVNSKVDTGAAKPPEHREEDKAPCAAAVEEEEEEGKEEEASDHSVAAPGAPGSLPETTTPQPGAPPPPSAAAAAAPAAAAAASAAVAEREEKEAGATAQVPQGVPPTPRTPPPPQAAPLDGAGGQEEAGKEHVLVRVLPDGTLVPISTGGLKKVRKEMSHFAGEDPSQSSGTTVSAADSRGLSSGRSPPTVTKPSLDAGKLDPSTAVKPGKVAARGGLRNASTAASAPGAAASLGPAKLAAQAIAKKPAEVQVKHLRAMAPEMRSKVLLCLDEMCPDAAAERRAGLDPKEAEPAPAAAPGTSTALGGKAGSGRARKTRKEAKGTAPAAAAASSEGNATASAAARGRPVRSTRCSRSLAEMDLLEEPLSAPGGALPPAVPSAEAPGPSEANHHRHLHNHRRRRQQKEVEQEDPAPLELSGTTASAAPTRKRLKLSLSQSNADGKGGQQTLVMGPTTAADRKAKESKRPPAKAAAAPPVASKQVEAAAIQPALPAGTGGDLSDGDSDDFQAPSSSGRIRKSAAESGRHSRKPEVRGGSRQPDDKSATVTQDDASPAAAAAAAAAAESPSGAAPAAASAEEAAGSDDATDAAVVSAAVPNAPDAAESHQPGSVGRAEGYDSEETSTEDEGAGGGDAEHHGKAAPGVASSEAQKAPAKPRISNSGRVGRVRQKSGKAVELLSAGERVRGEQGWSNQGYIFPEGFRSQTVFRSSVDVDQLCMHECSVIGKGGKFFPKPTFMVVAMDRKDEPLIAGSCTGCWTQALKRINAEIEALRKAGDPRPAPPKTAIAGPEYFGLVDPYIKEQIEALDPERVCVDYWEGSQHLEALKAGHEASRPPPKSAPRKPPAAESGRPRRNPAGGTGRRAKRRNRGDGGEEGGLSADEDDEASYTTNRWSSVSRNQRYKKRCGGDAVDEDNPLPGFMDPITLEPVVDPAISPSGHVMGSATWKAVLAEQGKCPFTQAPLSWSQLKVLTKNNIHLYKDLIKK